MSKRIKIFLTTWISILLIFAFSLVVHQPTYGATFGDQPMDDVLNSASENLSGTGITTNNFASMLLAPTWAEVTGQNVNFTPSPMAVGRYDVSTSNGTKLWSDGIVSSNYQYVRAHWSAGVGLWQLDSSGLGSNLSFHNAVLTNTASNIVASEMARLYKSASGSALEKRRAAWGPWFGCGNLKSACENIYQQIYYSNIDVVSVTRDSTVRRGGGLVSRTCYNSSNPSVTWSCYKYNVANAQGHTGSWDFNPLNGSSSLQPLPLPFYTYWKLDASSNKSEYRHWLLADTGYNTSKWAVREFGTNARSSVNWYNNSPLGVGW